MSHIVNTGSTPARRFAAACPLVEVIAVQWRTDATWQLRRWEMLLACGHTQPGVPGLRRRVRCGACGPRPSPAGGA